MNYEGKLALVLGLGESGLAMAQWLARCGALRARGRYARRAAAPGALREAVPTPNSSAANSPPRCSTASISSPSARAWRRTRNWPIIVPAALERNIPVWGEIELFAQALAAAEGGARLRAESHRDHRHQRQDHRHQPDRPAVPPRRPSTRVAGNISPAALDVLREALAEDSCRRPGCSSCRASSCTPPSA
jgi:UDP-N-acetylmuramoylalanine--D-glutamate ligase